MSGTSVNTRWLQSNPHLMLRVGLYCRCPQTWGIYTARLGVDLPQCPIGRGLYAY